MNGSRLQTAHVVTDRYAEDFDAVFGAALPGGWRERVRALPAEGKPGRTEGCQANDASEPALDAYDCLPASDRELVTTILVSWAKALAAYQRRLVSRDSAFDRFLAEGPQSPLLTQSAKRGARLFVGKASCIDCHNGPLLSDDDFHDIGIPQIGMAVPTVAECTAGSSCDCVAGKGCLPWGAFNGQTWIRDASNRWLPLIAMYREDGAAGAKPSALGEPPLDEGLKGAWRTPSLRDVALTAPYMHNGAYRTLDEVLDHYDTGGRRVAAMAVGTPSPKLKPLSLAPGEKADLIEFLKTLTGAPLPAALATPTPPR